MKTMEVRLTLNGEPRTWTIAPGDLLLDVLRREGCFGVKRGCEKGECGACVVLLDGRAVNSCLMFAAQAEGREVVTIEGLAHGGKLDPLQETFLDHGAVQCGFCTPGMVIGAKALLMRHPHPTEEQVREALAGHLCRCTGYKKPVEAVLAAAARMPDRGSRARRKRPTEVRHG
jgi:aerobic-type carbon monoxide dehydrogenase small subunit (CoxS/CutS family)